jgi:hypothetical protein
MKKEKLVDQFITFVAHDFGAYNAIWKWADLPEPINKNFELLESKLKEWEGKNYIRIFEENGEKMIEFMSVPEN